VLSQHKLVVGWLRYNVRVRRVLFVGFALLALGVGVARGGGSAPIPLPCGLPQTQPLWVDYADGMVPFWSTIFARPGIVGAASNFIVPPQLRAKGAQTVYFDLYMNNRVGTPSKPADPSLIQARADKLFQTAVTSSGCDHPLIAENELSGANLPTPWTPTTAQYRANVLAYLQRLTELGARPFLLLPQRPYTHDEGADQWWRDASQVADLVPEVYFSAPPVSKLGPVAGSRKLRGTMRTRMEDLIEIGVPTNRLGMMLTFSSTPKAGGREGLQPLSKWLDVTKWEALASKQVASELSIASIWSWGWAAFNPAGNDPDKQKVACAWLWTRDHSLCDAPAIDGKDFDTSVDVGATLPAGTLCILGKDSLQATLVAALSRLTGDRDLAYSAALQHLVLAQAKSVATKDIDQAVVDTILDHFGGSRAAYNAALARAKTSTTLARTILADELRRRAVEATLHVPNPTLTQEQAYYSTYSGVSARIVKTAKPLPWLANKKSGVAVQGVAPGRLFAMAPGESVKVDGIKVTVQDETAPLGAYPFAQAAPVIKLALIRQARDEAFATWSRKRQNQSLQSLACQHDQAPQPSTVELTDWLPYLSLG
jgi:hypothetical protein